MRIRIGQRVRVNAGSGLDSGKLGIVIHKSKVPTDGQGVPRMRGYYRPMEPTDVAIITPSQEIIVIPRSRVTPE